MGMCLHFPYWQVATQHILQSRTRHEKRVLSHRIVKFTYSLNLFWCSSISHQHDACLHGYFNNRLNAFIHLPHSDIPSGVFPLDFPTKFIHKFLIFSIHIARSIHVMSLFCKRYKICSVSLPFILHPTASSSKFQQPSFQYMALKQP
jgi:hypothetical protein